MRSGVARRFVTRCRPSRFRRAIRYGSLRILFVVPRVGSSEDSLRQADALASRFDGELSVLRLIDPPSKPSFFRRAPRGARSEIEACMEALEATRSLCGQITGRTLSDEQLQVRFDPPLSAIVETASDLRAALIVMASDVAARGQLVVDVARRSGTPVLLTRQKRLDKNILAATDLADPNYPVVRCASDFAARLGVKVTFVHNQQAIAPPLFTTPNSAIGGIGIPEESAPRDCRMLLGALTEETGEHADFRILSRASTIAAILDVAEETHVDLIAVGLRRRPWLGRLFSQRTAQRLVERTSLNVLVIPFSARTPSVVRRSEIVVQRTWG